MFFVFYMRASEPGAVPDNNNTDNKNNPDSNTNPDTSSPYRDDSMYNTVVADYTLPGICLLFVAWCLGYAVVWLVHHMKTHSAQQSIL